MLQFRKEKQGTERTKNFESRVKHALEEVPHLKSSPIGRGEKDRVKSGLRFVLFLLLKSGGQTREGV